MEIITKIVKIEKKYRTTIFCGKHCSGKTSVMIRKLCEEALNGKKVLLIDFENCVEYIFRKLVEENPRYDEIPQDSFLVRHFGSDVTVKMKNLLHIPGINEFDIVAIDNPDYIESDITRHKHFNPRDKKFVYEEYLPFLAATKFDVWITENEVNWPMGFPPYNYILGLPDFNSANEENLTI